MSRTRCEKTRLDQLMAMRRWCGQPLGSALCEVEQDILTPVLAQVFGYHLVAIDPLCRLDALQESRIPHKIIQTCTSAGLAEKPSLLACNESLPWQTDSIDAFVLPHALELSTDPHQLLRELDRCLVAEGNLIMLGFNPYGLWGMRRFLQQHGKAPWGLRFISLHRLRDWLSLLGYAIVNTQYYHPKLPWQTTATSSTRSVLTSLHRPAWPFLAGCYLLVARKRVTTLTPIKPRWRPQRSLLPGRAVEPSQRGMTRSEYE